MTHITLLPEKHLDDFITIVSNAYPGMEIFTQEDIKKFRETLKKITEGETTNLYGAYRDNTLVGGMIFDDFTMTLYTVQTLTGGVGMVAVDLVHKKEKVCKDMILYFLEHYHKKGACLTALYPFRPDFYRKMGFGVGAKMHQYRVKPDQFPRKTKDHIQFLDKPDKQLLVDCYTRYTNKTHGMMQKRPFPLNRIFEKPEYKIVGYKTKTNNKEKTKKGDKISGYMVFTLKRGDKDNFLINDIMVEEFIYETKEALHELLTFLHIQKDQIRHVIFNTQDEYFQHVFPDPRDCSAQVIPDVYHQSNCSGVGIMYRVINTEKFFDVLKDHEFGNETITLKISVTDTFFEKNNGDIFLKFEKGTLKNCTRTNTEHDVEIVMDISDFSSLVMGVVPFDRLYTYGLAEISDSQYIDTVTTIFKAKEKPVCTTHF
ncbi:MAG: GNAT family N-acetyltransferase [Candidatus Methanofastidiosia archaeon]